MGARGSVVNVITMTIAIGAMAVAAAAGAVAQDRAIGDRRGGEPAAVRAGAALFRERCTECHGADAKGVQGHDLTRLWTSGATDERVFQTIREGVPNTIMPSSSAADAEVWALVGYLRSLNGAGTTEAARGNPENGERIFWSACGGCHTVNGRGGPLGPDLSRITQSQTRESLTRAIRDPDASIPDGYQAVTIVTRNGQRIRGARKSEDAFSIQMMDTAGQLRGFLKGGLREVVRETSSLMPPFGPERLNDGDLADVLAFLGTLRAAPSGRP
jgi:putative heme-binding domain-containing protein